MRLSIAQKGLGKRLTVCYSQRENICFWRMRILDSNPKAIDPLPQIFRKAEVVKFDISRFPFKEAIGELLGLTPAHLDLELATYFPEETPFSYTFAKKLRESILRKGQSLLAVYEEFIKSVVSQHMQDRRRLDRSQTERNLAIRYQYPPTLRIYPSLKKPKALGRLHTDYDYGHQDGEVNFWLPIINADKENATLWSESKPGKMDFTPFLLTYGEMKRFHAVSLQHGTYPNDTGLTRISLDFRVALDCNFDESYRHPSKTVNYRHHMRRFSPIRN